MKAAPILEVNNLKKHFPVRRGLLQRKVAEIKAVDGISFKLGAGETLCLVGESGCGKSTVGRLIVRLLEPTDGTITFNGQDITRLSAEQMRSRRKALQIVFQDPYASLNPRLTAATIVGEPLENFDRLTRSERERARQGIARPRRPSRGSGAQISFRILRRAAAAARPCSRARALALADHCR
jgi:peptide/nickel transport system ATP-binding protein